MLSARWLVGSLDGSFDPDVRSARSPPRSASTAPAVGAALRS
jgi:hypothetical protein